MLNKEPVCREVSAKGIDTGSTMGTIRNPVWVPYHHMSYGGINSYQMLTLMGAMK